jgi:hypothetical protein
MANMEFLPTEILQYPCNYVPKSPLRHQSRSSLNSSLCLLPATLGSPLGPVLKVQTRVFPSPLPPPSWAMTALFLLHTQSIPHDSQRDVLVLKAQFTPSPSLAPLRLGIQTLTEACNIFHIWHCPSPIPLPWSDWPFTAPSWVHSCPRTFVPDAKLPPPSFTCHSISTPQTSSLPSQDLSDQVT